MPDALCPVKIAFRWSTRPVYAELSAGGGVPRAQLHCGTPECNYTQLELNISCSLATSWAIVAPPLLIVVHSGVGIRWEQVRQQRNGMPDALAIRPLGAKADIIAAQHD